MDHDAYEKHMIDEVNRNAVEYTDAPERTNPERRVFTKADAKALRRGFKRMVVALFTALLFGLSIFAFIAAASATGYWAVILFFSAVVLTIWTVIFVYAQGITYGGKK